MSLAQRGGVAFSVLLLSVVSLLFAAPAAEAALLEPSSPTAPPNGLHFNARQIEEIALQATATGRTDGRALEPKAYFETPVSRRNWVIYYGKAPDVVEVHVSDQTGRITSVNTGMTAELDVARGVEVVSSTWVWVPLSLLFFFAFFDPKRPFRLLHLDLLVLLSFGITKFLIRDGHDALFVPLTYGALGYLFVRLAVAGFRPSKRTGRLAPLMPTKVLVVLLIGLTVFRIGVNFIDSRLLDVGYAGAVGASRVWEGEALYEANESHLDTYGPVNYLAYVPFERAFNWGGLSAGERFAGGSDDPIAAHLAAIFFDLLTITGLVLLGMRLRRGPSGKRLGLLLAYAWVTLPFSTYVLGVNSNDSLVAALLILALLALARPALRGLLLGLNMGVKFVAAPLLPLLATAGHSKRLGPTLVTAVSAIGVFAFAIALYMPDGGLREVYDCTLGYQLTRASSFSVWGQHPSLDWLQTGAKLGLVAFALLIAIRPRRKTPLQVAALAGAVVVGLQLITQHWFYFYVVWFAPLAFVALFGEYRSVIRDAGDDVTAVRLPSAGRDSGDPDELSRREAPALA
jgi:hypothetical protein